MSERNPNWPDWIEGTGVFAKPEEIAYLKQPVPMLVMGNRMPRGPQERAHDCALSHGLPEIEGYYGCDLDTGEFVRTKP